MCGLFYNMEKQRSAREETRLISGLLPAHGKPGLDGALTRIGDIVGNFTAHGQT